MHEDPVLDKLVRSLVQFAHGCDIEVVAEGVETADESAALLSSGVDYCQGWHFGRPGPAEALRGGAPVEMSPVEMPPVEMPRAAERAGLPV